MFMDGGVKTHVDTCGPHGIYGLGVFISCHVTLHIDAHPFAKFSKLRQSISSDKAVNLATRVHLHKS